MCSVGAKWAWNFFIRLGKDQRAPNLAKSLDHRTEKCNKILKNNLNYYS